MQRQRKVFESGTAKNGERGAQPYNVGLGAEPRVGSRGRAFGQGVRGRSPPEAETLSLLAFGRLMEAVNLPTFFHSKK